MSFFFIIINYSIIVKYIDASHFYSTFKWFKNSKGLPSSGSVVASLLLCQRELDSCQLTSVFLPASTLPCSSGQPFKFLGILLRHVRSKTLPTVAGLMLRLRRYPALNLQLHTQPQFIISYLLCQCSWGWQGNFQHQSSAVPNPGLPLTLSPLIGAYVAGRASPGRCGMHLQRHFLIGLLISNTHVRIREKSFFPLGVYGSCKAQ